MTDHAELRRLAELADALYGMPSLEHEYAISKFRVASTPKTILAMLDEIDGLRSRLEIDERTPHDGIACRNETIKVLDEKCDRLKAENEALRSALKPFADYCTATDGKGIRLAIGGSCGDTEIDRAEWKAAQAALEGATQ
ncbi:hypothetical protein [Pseudomonas paraeruginosa]|uniref:hypothetical protein n=1 Tax=Pseudomonas paraeruginosa TaxID=2994495 RepID=UPI0039FD005A